jgi:hypothetical protein
MDASRYENMACRRDRLALGDDELREIDRVLEPGEP